MKKKDMYIDYKRSFKRRGRRHSKLPWILFVVILVTGLSIAAFYSIRLRIDHNKTTADAKEQKSGLQQKNQEETLLAEASPAVTKAPMIATPTPKAVITLSPTPTPLAEETIEVMDTRNPVKVKGIYVTSAVAGSTTVDSLIALADETEINTMVIDIKDDLGRITYQMDNTTAKEIGATTNTIKDIDAFVKKLKEREIYLIARIVAFKDPYLADKKKSLAIKNKDGSIYLDNNGEGWVNPYNHKVWDYLIEVASQAASAGFDEIQFDYIRFSTGNRIANADFGKTAKEMTKEDIITEFTKYAYESLKPLGVYVSADVYGTIINSSVDAGLVGQNYVEMAKNLDYICPMIYPSHFGEGNYGIQYPDLEPANIIRKALTASSEKLSQIPEGEHRAIVRPWLQDFTATWVKHYMKYGAEELREQINGVYDAGYEEWLLWNAVCNYSEDGLLKE